MDFLAGFRIICLCYQDMINIKYIFMRTCKCTRFMFLSTTQRPIYLGVYFLTILYSKRTPAQNYVSRGCLQTSCLAQAKGFSFTIRLIFISITVQIFISSKYEMKNRSKASCLSLTALSLHRYYRQVMKYKDWSWSWARLSIIIQLISLMP